MKLEACQFRMWRPWHAYDPDDTDERTLCGVRVAGAVKLWRDWDEQTFDRCRRCTRMAASLGR